MHSRSIRTLGAAALFVGLSAACSDDDGAAAAADFSGIYTLSVTNKENGCEYQNWQPEQSTPNIQFEIAQSGTTASGTLKGLSSWYFALLGIGTMQGTVDGDVVSMTAVGEVAAQKAGCAYFVRATVDATIVGDAVNGTVTYSNETNKGAGCGILDTCRSVQAMSGSRPPK